MEITWRVISGEVEGKNGGKVQGTSSINARHKIDHGRLRNSIGNVEAKELISMTPGHEL